MDSTQCFYVDIIIATPQSCVLHPCTFSIFHRSNLQSSMRQSRLKRMAIAAEIATDAGAQQYRGLSQSERSKWTISGGLTSPTYTKTKQRGPTGARGQNVAKLDPLSFSRRSDNFAANRIRFRSTRAHARDRLRTSCIDGSPVFRAVRNRLFVALMRASTYQIVARIKVDTKMGIPPIVQRFGKAWHSRSQGVTSSGWSWQSDKWRTILGWMGLSA